MASPSSSQSDSPTPPTGPVGPGQAKITQKLVLRTLVGVIVLGGLFLGLRWFLTNRENLDDISPSDTAGLISAVQFLDDGQEAVVIKPDGTVVGNNGYAKGNTDRDVVWRPDGNRILFVSDRAQEGQAGKAGVKAFNIYRWDPVRNIEPSQRTVGSRGRGFPEFAADLPADQNKTALIISGGLVLEFDPKERATRQVLPPLGREVTTNSTEEGGGEEGQVGALYGEFGNSFQRAMWMHGKQYIAAVMQRDAGEILIVQPMEEKDGRMQPPVPVAAGDRIDMAVNPKDGSLVYSVEGFQFPNPNAIPPRFRQGNKILRPFAHMVGIFDPSKGLVPPIIASPDDRVAFGAPAISPDGATVALTIGPYQGNGSFDSKGIILVPDQPGGASATAHLVVGDVYEPSWHPSGNSLVYVKRGADGKRAIYTINKDGSAEKDVTGDRGNFGNPRFSPQSK